MAKYGALLISLGCWIASFVQWRGYASEAGGIMWLTNTIVILATVLTAIATRYRGAPKVAEKVASAWDMPGACFCPGSRKMQRGMLIGRCRNCQGWREVK